MSNYNTALQNNNSSLEEIINKLNAMPDAGTDTSDATAAAADIMLGKSAYVAEGKVTGTFTIDSELNTQDSLISQIIDVANNLPDAGSGSNSIATCDVTLMTNHLPMFFYYTTCFTEAEGIFPLTPAMQGVNNNTILKNVVCGSFIVIKTASPIIFNYTVTGGAALIKRDSQFCFFSIPQQPTGTVTITVIEED